MAVPQLSLRLKESLSPPLACTAKPMSHSLTCPQQSMRMFSGLRSRYTICG